MIKLYKTVHLKWLCVHDFLQLVGRNVGQLFRKEVCFAELPRLDLPRRYKTSRLDEVQSDMGLCTLFKSDENIVQ
jgi:hypothetical protein